MSTKNIMYSEIDQNKRFDNFFRCLERKLKWDCLYKFALALEESPFSAATQEVFEFGQPKLFINVYKHQEQTWPILPVLWESLEKPQQLRQPCL